MLLICPIWLTPTCGLLLEIAFSLHDKLTTLTRTAKAQITGK